MSLCLVVLNFKLNRVLRFYPRSYFTGAFSFSYLAMVALISLFKKILHRAAKDFCEAENRLRAGFIDILVVLLVHLN